MKFRFMKDHNKEFCIEKMAKVFQVSRAGYYKFLRKSPGKRELENQRILKEIRKVYETSRKTYGSPRIHGELKKAGESCSKKRIARLMKQAKIQPKMRKHWKKTTKSNPKEKAEPNHLVNLLPFGRQKEPGQSII